MSKWTDQYDNHAFDNSWWALVELATNFELAAHVDESTVEELARLRKGISHLSQLIENIDPELFPISQLAKLLSIIQPITAALNGFIDDSKVGHLVQANAYLDQLLALRYQLPMLPIGSKDALLKDDMRSYSEAVEDYVKRYRVETEHDVGKLRSLVSDVRGEIEFRRVELESLEEAIKNISLSVPKQLAEFNGQFQVSEIDRSGKFDESFGKYESQVNEEFKNLVVKSATIIETLVKLQDDAKKVYGVTVNTLQGGAYSSYASDEGKIANILRYLAGALMLLALAIIVAPEVLLMIGPKDYIFDWLKALGRVPLSLVVFVPAFYLARESGKHRQTEVSNRRRQHILTTLDPYIELMGKDEAQEIKTHVAKTVFSEGEAVKGDNSDEGNILAQVANLIKQFKG